MNKNQKIKELGENLLIEINNIIGNDEKEKQEFKDYLKARKYDDKDKKSIAKIAMLLNYLYLNNEG